MISPKSLSISQMSCIYSLLKNTLNALYCAINLAYSLDVHTLCRTSYATTTKVGVYDVNNLRSISSDVVNTISIFLILSANIADSRLANFATALINELNANAVDTLNEGLDI